MTKQSIYPPEKNWNNKSRKALIEELRIIHDELERTNTELLQLTLELDDRVEKRTVALKQSQAKLIQTEKIAAIGTLTAGIAHELNNPLMGMLNFIQYCLRHTEKDDKRYGVLVDAERETKRCADIVGNFLIFSRSDCGGKETAEKCSLAVIMERVFRLLNYRIVKENVTINLSVNDDVPYIHARQGALQQVFLNLLSNALDALEGQEEKVIDIRLIESDRHLVLSIRDNGSGIDPDLLDNIYDPFFSTKPPGKGTGLGLSVSQSIIKDHNGKIECISNINEGTTFEIWLPVNRHDS